MRKTIILKPGVQLVDLPVKYFQDRDNYQSKGAFAQNFKVLNIIDSEDENGVELLLEVPENEHEVIGVSIHVLTERPSWVNTDNQYLGSTEHWEVYRAEFC